MSVRLCGGKGGASPIRRLRVSSLTIRQPLGIRAGSLITPPWLTVFAPVL